MLEIKNSKNIMRDIFYSILVVFFFVNCSGKKDNNIKGLDKNLEETIYQIGKLETSRLLNSMDYLEDTISYTGLAYKAYRTSYTKSRDTVYRISKVDSLNNNELLATIYKDYYDFQFKAISHTYASPSERKEFERYNDVEFDEFFTENHQLNKERILNLKLQVLLIHLELSSFIFQL
ncbi:MAG: hypothetical protein HYU68_07960 [Bacteroidetes bacterium]|nr:hypothetical protein [Bacteroidota bacterium]